MQAYRVSRSKRSVKKWQPVTCAALPSRRLRAFALRHREPRPALSRSPYTCRRCRCGAPNLATSSGAWSGPWAFWCGPFSEGSGYSLRTVCHLSDIGTRLADNHCYGAAHGRSFIVLAITCCPEATSQTPSDVASCFVVAPLDDEQTAKRQLGLSKHPSQSRVSGVTLDADVSNFWDSSGTWTGNCRAVCGILALVHVRECPDVGGGLTIWGYGDQDQPKNCQ